MEDMRKNIVTFNSPVYILEGAAVGGKKEGEGPIGSYFDEISEDTRFGEDTWEKAEIRLQMRALDKLIIKAGIKENDVECIYSGDLLNQCIASSYALRKRNIPVFGIYSACATFCEGLVLASMAVDGGYKDKVIVQTSSHYCTAERQYRFPLEYGGSRTPTSQWTVTGSGAVLLSRQGNGPRITKAVPGRITDLGIVDANNMGSAMAPAGADTLVRFFKESNTRPDDYDLIVSGDLGHLGRDILRELLKKEGFSMGDNYTDGGCMIFDESQDIKSGGSGCGCISSVFSGRILSDLRAGKIKKMLMMATGALLSPTIVTQSESIASIAHLVQIEA